jgi:hypothetical protein
MHALILTLWALLAPGAERLADAGRIASAIEAVVGGDERMAAVMATYAWRESSLQLRVVGDGGRSCGVWQEACSRIAGLSLEQQAALWLSDVRASSLAAVDSSPSRAARRERLAVALLDRARAMVP